MKAVFGQWYEPGESEIATFVKEGTIALDTNVLFSLYRMNSTQRGQVLDLLTEVANRVWIPYQVGLEYQRGRLDRIADQRKAYESVRSAVAAVKTAADKAFRDPEICKQVTDKIDAFARDMGPFLDGLHSAHSIDDNAARLEDPVRMALDEIFVEGRIGPVPVDLDDRKKRANERIAAKTPPGYKDANKPDPTGDCLIWFELLDLGKSAEGPVLFITDDTKEDWYRRVQGELVGPLPALRAEWSENSDVPYHQTTLASFLEHAKRHLKTTIDEDTISSATRESEDPQYSKIMSKLIHPSRSSESRRLLTDLPVGGASHDVIVQASEMVGGLRDFDQEVAERAVYLIENQASVEREAVKQFVDAIGDGPQGSEYEFALRRLEHLAQQGMITEPSIRNSVRAEFDRKRNALDWHFPRGWADGYRAADSDDDS